MVMTSNQSCPRLTFDLVSLKFDHQFLSYRGREAVMDGQTKMIPPASLVWRHTNNKTQSSEKC